MKEIILALTFFALSFHHQSFGGLIGPEFELTNELMLSNSKSEFPYGSAGFFLESASADDLSRAVSKFCKKTNLCKIHYVKGYHNYIETVVTLEDGFWFKISIDPVVIEIQSKPMPPQYFLKNETILNHLIFTIARERGYYPIFSRSAHVNFGIEDSFYGDPELFLRFYTDYINNEELSLGTLGHDIENGIPFHLLDKNSHNKYLKLVQNFNRKKNSSIIQIAKGIRRILKNATSDLKTNKGGAFSNSALDLSSVNYFDTEDLWRIEFRGLWGQVNIKQFAMYGKLFSKRVDFLRKQTGKPVIFLKPTKRSSFTDEELITKFFIYTTESGANFEEFKILVHPQIRNTKINKFFTEKLNLDNFQDYRKVKSLSRDIILSDFVRQRFFEQMKMLDIGERTFVRRLLFELIEHADQNPYVQKKVKDLIEALFLFETWQGQKTKELKKVIDEKINMAFSPYKSCASVMGQLRKK